LKVLLTGRHGQLGQALQASCPADIELIAWGRKELDLSDADACQQAVQSLKPDWVLNAGAYTAVDRAESEPELSWKVNAEAPKAFAEALANSGGRLLQVSTDFVFNGKQGHPYTTQQAVDPIGVYGSSKAGGEKAVLETLPAERFCILRTSWVYGPVGKNFCLTMLRLHAERGAVGTPLSVVADQVGCPTATPGLAEACWSAVKLGLNGVHHWSDAGAASWYDFATAIGNLGAEAGFVPKPAEVKPIRTVDYPTPAKRPSYSLLDCVETRRALGIEPKHWQEALHAVIHLIKS
jgi:dTDP-4-dehydrorhamnose reductase